MTNRARRWWGRDIAMGPSAGRVVAVAVLALFVAASGRPQVFQSPPGRPLTVERPYEIHLAAATGCDPAGDAARSTTDALVVMVHRGEDGTSKEVWRAALGSHPAWWCVDPRRGWLVTFGNACSYALDHAVVVYDGGGRVVRDYRVSDLFAADERRRLGYWERGDEPRTLGEDERIGNDIFSGCSILVFEEDAVWLTHPRVRRPVLLARR